MTTEQLATILTKLQGETLNEFCILAWELYPTQMEEIEKTISEETNKRSITIK